MFDPEKNTFFLIVCLCFSSFAYGQYSGGYKSGDQVSEFSGQLNGQSLPFSGGNGNGNHVTDFSGQLNGLSLPYHGGNGNGNHFTDFSGQLNGLSLPYFGSNGRGDYVADFSGQLNGLRLPYLGGNGRGDLVTDFSGQMIRIYLKLKIFLEGYYTGGGLMDNNGSGGLLYIIIPQISANPEEVDTVFISAMNANSPYDKIDKQWGILHTDGVVSVNFGGAVTTENYYYIRAEHRNAIPVWSATPVLISTNTTYIFSASQMQAFGNNMVDVGTVLGGPSEWALFSGDINQDGVVDGLDFLILDLSILDGAGGYDVSDLDGNGSVDGLDFLVLDRNIQGGNGIVIP